MVKFGVCSVGWVRLPVWFDVVGRYWCFDVWLVGVCWCIDRLTDVGVLWALRLDLVVLFAVIGLGFVYWFV